MQNVTGIFDSHAHYDDEAFMEDRADVIKMLLKNGVSGFLNVGCSVSSSKASAAMAEQYPFVWAAVGLHPDCADAPGEHWEAEITALAKQEKVVAIGEIGLDYHYVPPERERQLALFTRQLELAKELSLPVIIHSREAAEDTFRLLRQYRPKGVLHCFSGSVESAKEAVSMGLYIGFTGVVTFKNARRAKEVAAAIPLDRILLETDCPYMAPEPFRGQRTTSDMIAYTASAIADIRGISVQEVIDAARENTFRLFRFKL